LVNSPKEYEELAISLAINPKKLAAIRNSLFLNLKSKPLFDTMQFTKDLEKIYTKIYKDYLEI
jgi:predicted O-linked N-acetylglucosamine transferase (SPINDLY family)